MWWALIGQLAGAAAGEAASQMGKDKAMRLIQSVSDEYGKIDVPKLQELLLAKQKDTQLTGIKDDPAYRAQQSAADAQLNDVVRSGGLTLDDRHALNRIRQGSARSESAGRSAIEQGMAARGALDSGAQLAMQLQGNQQAANASAMADESAAAQAQGRLFSAIRERAQNAGAGLDRDYRRQSEAARAQDAINAGNTAIANTASRYNAGIPQQNFENQMRKVAGSSGATYATAGAEAAAAKDAKQTWQGIGNAAGAAGQSGYEAYKDSQAPGGATPKNSALSGEPTKQRQVIGYRTDGRPIYAEDMR